MADLVAPRRDEIIVDETGRPTLKFVRFLENLEVNVTEITIEETQVISNAAEIAQQAAQIKTLADRLNDFEASNDQDVLNAKITGLRSIVSILVDDLIEAVNNLDFRESDVEMIDIQTGILNKLELLNARVEDAFETKIKEEDLDYDND